MAAGVADWRKAPPITPAPQAPVNLLPIAACPGVQNDLPHWVRLAYGNELSFPDPPGIAEFMWQAMTMTAQFSSPVFNCLIQTMPSGPRTLLLAQCTPEQLVFGDVLCDYGKPIRHVHFPLTGFISLVATVGGHRPIEMGMIGNEGMLGATLTLGIGAAPLRAVVQGTACNFAKAPNCSACSIAIFTY
jgi:hypothetical protein